MAEPNYMLSMMMDSPIAKSYQQGFQNQLASYSAGIEGRRTDLAERAQALEEGKYKYDVQKERFARDKEEVAMQDQAAIAKATSNMPAGHKLTWDIVPTTLTDPLGRKYTVNSIGNIRYITDEEYNKKSANEKANIDALNNVARSIQKAASTPVQNAGVTASNTGSTTQQEQATQNQQYSPNLFSLIMPWKTNVNPFPFRPDVQQGYPNIFLMQNILKGLYGVDAFSSMPKEWGFTTGDKNIESALNFTGLGNSEDISYAKDYLGRR